MKRPILIPVALLMSLSLSVVLAGCGPSAADAAKMNAALDALSRLQSKVSANALYADYMSAVGDTKGEVDLFTESTAAKSYPEVAAASASTMRAYVAAGHYWSLNKEGSDRTVSELPDWPPLLEEFPELSSATYEAGGGPAVHLNKAVPTLLSAAAEKVSAAKAAAPK